MSVTSVPVWHSLLAEHDPSARYSSNPRADLLGLLNTQVKQALEFGCGSGATAQLLKTRQPDVKIIGVERDAQAAEVARRYMDDVIVSDLDRLDFDSLNWNLGHFDLVIAGDVLEHLYNPWDLLERLRPYLSDNCQVLVSVPNIANAWIIAQLSAGHWEYEAEGLLDVTHIRFFTKSTAERLLSETGYTVNTMVRSWDGRIPNWPYGQDVESADLDIGGVVFKRVTSDRWTELRTLQYLIKACPLPRKKECAESMIPEMSFIEEIGDLKKPRKLRVGVLSLDLPQFACPEIRLIGPFSHLNNEFQLFWLLNSDSAGVWAIDRELLESSDIIVVQRFFPGKETIGFLEKLKSDGKILIYETDDLLTALPSSNPHYEVSQNQKPYIERFIRMADAVVVSTHVIKEAYAHLNSEIKVIPNYLNDELWKGPLPTRKARGEEVNILFAGTATHMEDLSFLLPVLEKVKEVHGDLIRFVFMGMSPPERARLGNVEVIQFESSYRGYLGILQDLSVDIVVVPLVDNPFNRAKSAIKWLEYSALGLPGIYSDLAPYKVIKHERTGLLVANTSEEWCDALDMLIRSSHMRREIGNAARDEVLGHWMLSRNTEEYGEFYRNFFSSERRDTSKSKDSVNTNVCEIEREWLAYDNKSFSTKIDVLIRANGNYDDDLVESRVRLNDQWVNPNTTGCLIDAGLDQVNDFVGKCVGDWVLLLREGDACDVSLLATLSRHIAERPNWVVIYFDEFQVNESGDLVSSHYKPDFNLEYLRSLPYVGNALAVRKSAFEALGGFVSEYEGVEELDFILRAYEKYGDHGIGHICGDMIRHAQSVNLTTKPIGEVLVAGRQAVVEHLHRIGLEATVEAGPLPATVRVHYHHRVRPLVTIIIPTRNQRALLDRCVQSLFANTSWPNFEIIVVDNASDEDDAVQFLSGLRELGNELNGRIRVIDYPRPFNYSEMNNLAANEACGEYLLLLNNDTAALHSDWLDEMMSYALRDDVAAVGAKLLFPDGKVQHAGVILGMKGPAEHPFIGVDAKLPGYFGRLQVAQEYSAVTGACLLVRKALFDEVGGLDACELGVSYSDIDLCLKLKGLGKRVIWTPYAVLLHEGSKSQKNNVEQLEDKLKAERFAQEQSVMYRRWLPKMASDPAYNRNLTLASTGFDFESDQALRWDPVWRPVPRIISQPADHMGCGEYRIIAPTRALINAGKIQGLESERIYTPPELARIKPDSLVLQRQLEPHQIKAIEGHKRINDIFCVFEIDDLITNVPVKNAHKKHLPKDIYKRLRKGVSLCDRLVVATEPLAEAYSGLCDDIRVVPNFIEEARWGGFHPLRCQGRKPRVGWAGGVSHTGDLELISGVVDALKDEVEWVFLGMCPSGMRSAVHEYHDPVSINEYPAKLASLNLDLAIAPLEDLPFNHAKSHLRLLEYGILGYPVVCSDLVPYQGGFPVTRVRNRYRDWVDAIRAHIHDLDATALSGDELRNHIRQHWLLENNLDAWLAAWLP